MWAGRDGPGARADRAGAVIGMGAVVLADVPDGQTWGRRAGQKAQVGHADHRLPARDGDRGLAASTRSSWPARCATGGHDVIVVAEPGPLVDTVRAMGLEYVPIPEKRSRPSPGVVRLLTRLADERSVDVVHGYEWPPAWRRFYGPRLRLGTPVVATILSSSIVPFFPSPIPLLVGTEQLQYAARAAAIAA